MGLFKRGDSSNNIGKIKILFTTDLHGSETAFRKFLNAGLMLKADFLIIGGDLAGKALVPIVDIGNGKYRVLDREVGKEGLGEVIKGFKNDGTYYTFVDQKGYELLNEDKRSLDEAFAKAINERLMEWDSIAEEKLKGTSVKVYANLGNDDPLSLFDVIKSSQRFVKVEEEVINLNGYEMISYGYVNPTPWNTFREMNEEELYSKLKSYVGKLDRPERTILNLHAPPYGTNLDNAPLLDNNLKPVVKGGDVVMTHVGSKAIRKVIEEYQPLLGIHGHIHESRAFDKVGKTLIINPGSEYSNGLLHASYILIEGDKVKAHQFIVG
ncbi:MAG: metallophosphoesterase [Candidatus Aramenus sp.]|jgi:Icc-related predicted phosphoesterase|nr:metallophosphoesterase [Candidatus Aramenus sp.]